MALHSDFILATATMAWCTRLLVLLTVLGSSSAFPHQEQVVLQPELASNTITVQGTEVYTYQKDGIQCP